MSEVARARNHGRGWIGFFLKLLISAALLAAVIAANREAMLETLARKPSPGLFVAALACYLAGVMLALARWFLLVRAQELPFGMRDALRLGWIGMFFNLVIPGAVGGDVVKAAYVAREQHHKGRAIASIIIDRLVGLLGLFLLAAAFGIHAWNELNPRVRPIVVSAIIASVIVSALLLLMFTVRPKGPLARRLSRHPRGHRLVSELHATGLAYRRRLDRVALAIGMAAVTHTANVLAFACVARALFGSAAPSLVSQFTIVPLVLFSTAIPLPFSGLGASETVSGLLFQSVSFAGGALAMLGFRLLQLVAAVIGAAVYLACKAETQALLEPSERPRFIARADQPETIISTG